MELAVYLIIELINIYIYLIIFYIILGWIKEIRESGFYRVLGVLVEPFFRIFRGIFVFGGLDFTPMFGIILLQFILNFVLSRL